MTLAHPIKKSILAVCCLLTLSTGLFARENYSINDKLLQSFKQTFPDAQQVKWVEQPDKYMVNFKENGVLTRIEYDKEGNFVSSLRYYTEKGLPVNVLCRLQKKYADKKVFGVTELTTENGVEYFIKLEDDKKWYTVHSTAEGSMQLTEKYNKAE